MKKLREIAMVLLLLGLGFAPPGAAAPAQPSAKTDDLTPAYEIVRENIDLEVAANGQYWQSNEITYRPLETQGVDALRQLEFSYTTGYQQITVGAAFTLKKDGTKIVVPPSSILYGRGEGSAQGYNDIRTITVIFPNVEIGDQLTIVTNTQQAVPWFAGVFAAGFAPSRAYPVHDYTLAFTAPSSGMALGIDAAGLEASPEQSLGGKVRRIWHYHNDTPVKYEPDAVIEPDEAPHLYISTLPDYAAVAKLHGGLYRDKAAATPAITALAEQLTTGITDRRLQAKALYDWVATHVKYVDIVLGAGGFTPHKAADIMSSAYGDCKDHVMLLQALLSAKGIDSSPVLIRAGINQFMLPKTASPFLFDHLITYIPELALFVDSTAQYAPFGVLPYMDSGKTVLLVDSGKLAQTPVARNSTLRADTNLTVNKDGSADGETKVVSSGAAAVDLRGSLDALPVDGEGDYLRAALGAGSNGKLHRSSADDLSEVFSFSADYHIANLALLPGPGAFPVQLGYKPFSFSHLIGGTLPPARSTDYVCTIIDAEEHVTVTVPHGVKLAPLPKSRRMMADRTSLQMDYKLVKPDMFEQTVKLHADYPDTVCSAAYYAKIHDDLVRMLSALKTQILYR